MKHLTLRAVFLWRATQGHRIRPWRSPYLRWRIETYWGWHAEQITPRQFRLFMWEHRAELLRFLDWAARMDAAAGHS
jgi:hypothetical protein